MSHYGHLSGRLQGSTLYGEVCSTLHPPPNQLHGVYTKREEFAKRVCGRAVPARSSDCRGVLVGIALFSDPIRDGLEATGCFLEGRSTSLWEGRIVSREHLDTFEAF